MRKLFPSLLLIVSSLFSYSQISITPIAPPKKNTVIVFDSTKNLIKDEGFTSYTGQLLFIKPRPECVQDEGYYGFYPITGNIESSMNVHFGTISPNTVKHDQLANKYFIVDSAIIYKPSIASYNLLFLSEKDNPSNRFIYNCQTSASTCPFLIVSHLNYLKKTFIGKKYYINPSSLFPTDIITGETINFPDPTITTWLCTDVTLIEDVRYANKVTEIALIMKNGSITTYIPSIKVTGEEEHRSGAIYLFPTNKYNALVAKYGKTNLSAVLNGYLTKGMPELLLQYSLGKPNNINVTSEGVIYSYKYIKEASTVILKNDKVLSWY